MTPSAARSRLAISCSVLVVDDHESNRKLLRAILESEGIRVHEAANGQEALALMRLAGGMQAIISDVLMPRMDGLQLCLEVRKSSRFQRIPFVFYTANYNSAADRDRAMRSGADAYLIKPVPADTLLRVLAEAIEQAKARPVAARSEADEVGMMTDHNLALIGKLEQKNGELEQALGQLSESEARFRQVVEAIHEVFWMTNADKTQLLYVSPAYERIWGRSCDSVRASPQAWLDAIYPEDRARIRQAAYSGQQMEDYCESYRIVRPDGEVRWICDRSYPIRDAAGRIDRIVGVAEDVTERKKLEDQFLRAQRLEAVGSLASGIAHDMNNILAPIMMAAPLLREDLDADKRDRFLCTIENSAARGAHLVRQLLCFGRGLEGERSPLRLKDALREIDDIVRQTFPRSIELTTAVSPESGLVLADPTQIHQILLNLCVNARDAMPTGGHLSISVVNSAVNASTPLLPIGLPAGTYVQITVADTGCGIPEWCRPRIFDPYFTTKEVGKGTGLGLPTIAAIAKAHDGFVTFESEVGQGTKFHVFLPALADSVPIEPCLAAKAAAPGRNETILIVDDEESICDVVKATLARGGYRVLVAHDGAEAAVIFTRNVEEIAVVVTDLDMPFLDGLGLIRVIKSVKPEARVVLTTGAPSNLVAPERRAALESMRITDILLKPFTPDRILAAVRASLSAPHARAA